MKAQELRIGNYIGVELTEFPENYFTVVEVAESSAVMTQGLKWHPQRDREYFTPEDCEGIPLSEHWLERMGFHGINDDGLWGYPDAVDNYIFQLEHKYLEGENSFVHIWDAAYTGAPVKYVHQIQNLIFSLTGSELSIQP